MPIHTHLWTVVDRWGHWEYHGCHCGDFKKVYVD